MRLDDLCYIIDKAQVDIRDARKSKKRGQMAMFHAKEVFQYVRRYLQLITECCVGDGSVYRLRATDIAYDESAPEKSRVLNVEIQCKGSHTFNSNIHVMILNQISLTRWTR